MPISVEKALATGVSSEARSCAGLARGFVFAALRAVDGDGGGVADRARRAGQRAHGQQHALDVGVSMIDDALPAGAALLALARIGERLLRRALGDRHALQADREPRRFIIVNMQAMPLCSSPMRKPTAPPLSP